MSGTQKIFIKAPNWIGDAILATPALHLLRHALPDAHITVMARPWVADVYCANLDIDRLWTEEDKKKGWRNFLAITSKIRAEKFDIGIAFPNSLGSALLMALGRVKQRVGYNRDGRGILLTDSIAADSKSLSIHMVEYYINLLSPICSTEGTRELTVPTPPEAIETITKTLAESLPSEAKNRPLAAFSPGATGGTAKRWLPERFAAVADHLYEKWGVHSLILGSQAERDIAEEMAHHAKHPITILAGKCTIRETIALCDRLSLFVCNDSGLMHLAAAKDVPLVAIFGPTEYVATAPYHPRAILIRQDGACPEAPCMRKHCPYDHHACMTAVSAEMVIAAVDQQMQKGSSPFIPNS
ncbi:TPA: lipopolysaccharide heptosyltransferase II [Candidatus Sumerlaeota bacterium]|jgi:heptosyltransferase II|nr:lipopolysaccharide heptosyltransferase II [Candidatus Sumerlaeota bacterium]